MKEELVMKYGEIFYRYVDRTARESAKEMMIPIIRKLAPCSIVDFGCGEGMWLHVASSFDNHIEILGLDGDYVDRSKLKINENAFVPTNISKEVHLDRKYDLAISLEVGEHIDKDFADVYLDNLTNASDHILFSAAIPGQGGKGHVNEQWQSWWIKKFKERGFEPDFSVRNYFWNNNKIMFWYRQNVVFYSKTKDGPLFADADLYDVVHPDLFRESCSENGFRLGRFKRIFSGLVEESKLEKGRHV